MMEPTYTADNTLPLYPREMRPVICQKRLCEYEFSLPPWSLLEDDTVLILTHKDDGKTRHFKVTGQMVGDLDWCAQAAVERWVTELHDQHPSNGPACGCPLWEART